MYFGELIIEYFTSVAAHKKKLSARVFCQQCMQREISVQSATILVIQCMFALNYQGKKQQGKLFLKKHTVKQASGGYGWQHVHLCAQRNRHSTLCVHTHYSSADGVSVDRNSEDGNARQTTRKSASVYCVQQSEQRLHAH